MNDQPVKCSAALRRILGPFDATCVVVGAIIGVGIFFTPSRVAVLAGSSNLALLAWLIGGTIALMGALTFAELGGLYPNAGAQYEVLRDAYGPLPAFLFVFCNATAVQAGSIAIIAIICAQNLSLGLVYTEPAPLFELLGAFVLITGLVVANCLGVKCGAFLQNATVVAKVATLVVLGLLALALAPEDAPGDADRLPSAVNANTSLFGTLFAALVPALFSYGGWQHALWIAGEIRQARRNVPLAMIAGVSIVILVYLLANWAYFRLLGYHGVVNSEALAARAVESVWPQYGRRITAVAVAASAFGVLNAQFLSGPRLVLGMARDGRFFRPFAKVSIRYATPVSAIALLGVMAITILLVAGKHGLDKILTGVVFVDTVFFVLTGAALLVLRRRRPDAQRPVLVPAYPFVPILFVAGETAVLIGAYCDQGVRQAAYIGVIWIAVAAACYLMFFRRPRRLGDQATR
jgi:APA family basic amino acid/polyamine antiporter